MLECVRHHYVQKLQYIPRFEKYILSFKGGWGAKNPRSPGGRVHGGGGLPNLLVVNWLRLGLGCDNTCSTIEHVSGTEHVCSIAFEQCNVS